MTEAEALKLAVEAAQTAMVAAERAASRPPTLVQYIQFVPPAALISIAIGLALYNIRHLNARIRTITRLSMFGMNVEFELERKISEALELRDKTIAHMRDIVVSDSDKKRAVARAERLQPLLLGRRILWIDDEPRSVRNEADFFSRLGISVTFAASQADADRQFAIMGDFDLVLSDVKRGEVGDAGLVYLRTMRETGRREPVIFYINDFRPEKGVPGNAFGITDRPDDLVHLVLDAFERQRRV